MKKIWKKRGGDVKENVKPDRKRRKQAQNTVEGEDDTMQQ